MRHGPDWSIILERSLRPFIDGPRTLTYAANCEIVSILNGKIHTTLPETGHPWILLGVNRINMIPGAEVGAMGMGMVVVTNLTIWARVVQSSDSVWSPEPIPLWSLTLEDVEFLRQALSQIESWDKGKCPL